MSDHSVNRQKKKNGQFSCFTVSAAEKLFHHEVPVLGHGNNKKTQINSSLAHFLASKSLRRFLGSIMGGSPSVSTSLASQLASTLQKKNPKFRKSKIQEKTRNCWKLLVVHYFFFFSVTRDCSPFSRPLASLW